MAANESRVRKVVGSNNIGGPANGETKSIDHRARILRCLEARVEALAQETTRAILEEVPGFGPIRDQTLADEVLALARQGIGLLVGVLARNQAPSTEELGFIRERALRRAHQLVPLAALLHAYLIANRVVGHAIAGEAGTTVPSTQAALALTAMASEYTLRTTTVMADAYVDAVQGDLADLERQRRELVDALLTSGPAGATELTRMAAGLGIAQGDRQLVVVGTVSAVSDDGPTDMSRRWAAQAIARSLNQSSGPPFVVIRGSEIVAVVRAHRPEPVVRLLQGAASLLRQSRGEVLTAGIGPGFIDLAELRASYDEARRALRHATPTRPFVVGPTDVRLFDEFTTSAGGAVAGLIPDRTRAALEDPILRATLEAFSSASLNVGAAAQALHLHPNTLRYRLRRIGERTGRDPHVVRDLVELIAAARIMNRSEREAR